MKTSKFIFTVLVICIWSLKSFATIGNERTLFVDFFGQTVFNINENFGSLDVFQFEREDDLIAYCKSKKFTTIILKRLDEINFPSTTTKIFPHVTPVISITAGNQATYLRLADFLEKCRIAPNAIAHIAAADYPFARVNSAYTSNKFWDNIAIFNIYMANNGHPNAYFDILYGEQDYWSADEPDPSPKINYSTYYIPGLTYMKTQVKNNAVSYPNNKIDIISTYVGDFEILNTIQPQSDQVSNQQQADDIDAVVDWVYMAFYFQGFRIQNAPVHTVPTNPQPFFKTDKNFGQRLYCFAHNNYPLTAPPNNKTIIMLLFGGNASSTNVNSNYFGNYMDYDHSGYYDATLNPNLNFAPNASDWHDVYYWVKSKSWGVHFKTIAL